MVDSDNVLGALGLVIVMAMLIGLSGAELRTVEVRSRRVKPFVYLLIIILLVSFLQFFLVVARLKRPPGFLSFASTAIYTLPIILQIDHLIYSKTPKWHACLLWWNVMIVIDVSALVETLRMPDRQDLVYITATSYARSSLTLALFVWFRLDRGERIIIGEVTSSTRNTKLVDSIRSSGGVVSWIKRFRIFLPWIVPSSSKEWFQAIATFSLVLCQMTLGTWRVDRRTSLLNDIDAAINVAKSQNGLFPKVLRFCIVELVSGSGINLIKVFIWQNFTSSREARAKKYIFSFLMEQDADFHSSVEPHTMMRITHSGVRVLEALDKLFFEIVPKAWQLLVAIRAMRSLCGPTITLMGGYVLAIILIAAIRNEKEMIPLREETIQVNAKTSRIHNNGLQAYETTSQCGQIYYQIQRFCAAVSETAKFQFKVSAVRCKNAFLTDSAQTLGSFVCLWLAVMRAFEVEARGNSARGGSIVDSLDYTRQVWDTLSFFGNTSTELFKNFAEADELRQNLEVKSMTFGDESLRNPDGDIEFSDISYTYPDRKDTIFNKLNVVIKAGEVTVIVGANATGKTTFLNLLGRRHEVQEGGITVGGQNVKVLKRGEMGSLISYVSQKVYIFNETIEYNINYGRPGASLVETQAAAEAAGIHSDIMAMELKYKEKAGYGGPKLSGGQQQRIAVARALLRRSKVLLVDEPTSALDQNAQSHVIRTLTSRRDRDHQTVVMVTHNLDTAKHADRIIVFEKGAIGTEIAESGSHTELLGRGGEYARLWRNHTKVGNPQQPTLVG